MNHRLNIRIVPFAILAAACIFAGIRSGFAEAGAHPAKTEASTATTPRGHQFVWETWGAGNGLQQNTVLSIARAADGYLYIGTQEGLARFDGVKFTMYNNSSEWADQDLWVHSLLAARDGSIWAGTSSGLNRVINGNVTAFTMKSGLPDHNILALCEGPDGSIWIGTQQGLARFRENRFTTISLAPNSTGHEIRRIIASRSGGLWIATDGDLQRFRDGGSSSYPFEKFLGHAQISSLHEDRQGTLWIGATDGTLHQLKGDDLSQLTKKDDLATDAIKTIAEDQDGRIWIGTADSLSYYEEGRRINFSQVESSFPHLIETTFADEEGNLWLGTSIHGLVRIRKSKFAVIGKKEGLSNDVVASMLQSRDGSLWIATDDGLNRMKDDRVIETWTERDGLPDGSILSLQETRDGALWVGTDSGLCRYQDRRFKCYTEKTGLPSPRVLVIAEDRDGGLWFGTYRGIFHYSQGQFDTALNQGVLAQSTVNSLIVSNVDNSIWLTTSKYGLFRIHEGTLTNYTTADGLPTNLLNNVTQDREGTIWVGTERGLVRYRNNRFTTYDTHSGLPLNQVFAVIEDDYGSLWMTSNLGISRVPKKQFDELDQGKISKLTVFRYGHGDGMRSAECNASTQPIVWKTTEGRILVPTMNGMVVIDPKTIVNDTSQPKVFIEQVVVDQKVLPPGEMLEIGPDARNLEVQYTALSFFAPQQIRFKYKLENYDADWVDAGFRRSAFYTGVPPGKYRFRIIAANAEGKWNDKGAELSLRLRPTFYQTWWFIGLCAFLGVGLIFLVHRTAVAYSNEQLMKSIAMSLPTAMAVTDQHNSVQMLNEQFIKYFGYTADDIRTLEDWFHFAYPSERQRNLARADWLEAIAHSGKADASAVEPVWQVTRKDGTVRDVEFRFAQIRNRLIVTFNDVTERKRAEERLRELAARLQTIREEERAFISREIHDELGQLLTGLKLEVKWLENKLPSDATVLRQKTSVILELINDTIKAVRTIATEFRPSVLDNIGLMDAIEWQTEDFETRSGIRCEVIEKTDTSMVDPDRATAVFRVLQESLTNVMRHANATLVMVSLRQENDQLILQVEDDGRGIREHELARTGSLGLLGMRERVRQFNGEASIVGVPDEGTTVTVTVPLQQRKPVHLAAVS